MKYAFNNTLHDVRAEKTRYANGRPALNLVDFKTGTVVVSCTLNLVEHDIQPDEVILTNSQDHSDLLDFLARNHIVADTGRQVPYGAEMVKVCKILI